MLMGILTGERWTLLPTFLIRALCRKYSLTVYAIDNPPPPWRCYRLTHRRPRLGCTESMALFNKRLDAYLGTFQKSPINPIIKTGT
jgi:hypothetical protein